jgi:hypothetical protein
MRGDLNYTTLHPVLRTTFSRRGRRKEDIEAGASLILGKQELKC